MLNSTFPDLRVWQETQVLIARRLQYLPEEKTEELCHRTAGIGRGINARIIKFRANAA